MKSEEGVARTEAARPRRGRAVWIRSIVEKGCGGEKEGAWEGRREGGKDEEKREKREVGVLIPAPTSADGHGHQKGDRRSTSLPEPWER